EERIDVKLSKDSVLCLALLEAPELASEISELTTRSRQYGQARELANWILSQEAGDRRTLVRKLALDGRARERFYHLFDGIEHIPSRENTLAQAREMLNPNEEATRQQRLAALLRNFSNLSTEERKELKTLSSGTQS
ncbi:MAG: DNA primase, partial [Gammaproteobacteria bacterium]